MPDAVIEKLERILKSYAEQYNVNYTECNIKTHISGVVTITVKGAAVEWFFNHQEFIDWINNQ